MKIIQIHPNPNGGRPPIQGWNAKTPPDGYVAVECDTAPFYEYRGFVDITIVDGVCVAITGNQEALDAYLAEHPDVPPELIPDPITDLEQLSVDHEYRLIMLEMGV